jgi:hypothetical protein
MIVDKSEDRGPICAATMFATSGRSHNAVFKNMLAKGQLHARVLQRVCLDKWKNRMINVDIGKSNRWIGRGRLAGLLLIHHFARHILSRRLSDANLSACSVSSPLAEGRVAYIHNTECGSRAACMHSKISTSFGVKGAGQLQILGSPGPFGSRLLVKQQRSNAARRWSVQKDSVEFG